MRAREACNRCAFDPALAIVTSARSDAGRPVLDPRPQPLEGGGRPQHGARRRNGGPTICRPTGSPSPVKPHGTDAAGCPVRLNGYVNGIHAYGAARGGRRSRSGCRGPTLNGGQAIVGVKQQIVLLEERARVLPPGEPIEPRLHVLRGRVAQRALDDLQEAGIDLRAPVEVRRQARRRCRRRRSPHHASNGEGQRGVDLLHATAELAERARRPRAHRRHLGIDGVGEAEVVGPRHAQSLERAAQRLACSRRARPAASTDRARPGPAHTFSISAASATVRVMGPTCERLHAPLTGWIGMRP